MPILSRRALLAAAASLPALGIALPASAHHGWGGYDTNKSFTVTGEITAVSFENPHCMIEMMVDGKHWHFVLAPPARMQRRGVTPEMIAPGKTATVFGYPSLTEPDEARIEYIVIDGTRYELR